MEIKTSLGLIFDNEPTEEPPEDYSKGEVIFLTEKPEIQEEIQLEIMEIANENAESSADEKFSFISVFLIFLTLCII